MTEVERFFRRLVSTLAAAHPARLQGPIPLDDITGSILPYRTHRRALELDTVEDYEAVLLRLCAGEGDLVWTEPEEARKRFVQESRSRHPDLTVLYAFESVQLRLRPEPLLWALAPDPRADDRRAERLAPTARLGSEATSDEVTVADKVAAADEVAAADDAEPPEDSLEPVIVLGSAPFEVLPPTDDIEDAPRSTCLYCGGSLPTNRTVNFCPHCGQSQTRILCPECRSEVEPGWRHCVNCGAAVGDT